MTHEDRRAEAEDKLQAAVDAIVHRKRDTRLALVGPVFLQGEMWVSQVAVSGATYTIVFGKLDGAGGARLLREALPLRAQLIALLRKHFHRVLPIAHEAQFAASRAWHWPWANRETT
jgi:hypothetical protein